MSIVFWQMTLTESDPVEASQPMVVQLGGFYTKWYTDNDCLAVSCIAPLMSSSYLTEPVSAVTAKCVLMNETLQSFKADPSTCRHDKCRHMSNSRRGQRAHEYH